MIPRIKLLMVAVFAGINCYSQTTLPVPINIQASYSKGTRAVSGEPGKNYWQNHADYTLKINFEPHSRLLNGTVSIDYINNSPDTLKEVDFKLYPNLYKKGSVRNMPVLPIDVGDGVRIKQLSINHQKQDEKQWIIDGTNMTVKTPAILPGQFIHFDIAYAYTLNKTSHIRTGQVDSGAFFIAYFFPRIAVYDDIDGWNQQHYQGTQEFYNDFCHFNAEITVPGNYEVWATGNLKNADEVLKDKFAKRLTEAAKDDKVTDIFTEGDLKAGNITTNKIANTWKFEADSVTDVAFAISNHYLWKSSSLVVDPATGRRTRVDAVFNQHHEDYFEVINYARKTVEAMSYRFPKWPYPYPHETVFDGLDQMEYPMMVNDNPETKAEDGIELTDHEIFHTMFPFYMGVNETKYAWMDEGWATIGEWLISPMIDPKVTDTFAIEGYENNAGTESDPPIITLSTLLEGVAYETNSYPKPGLGYLYLKDMLGDEVFTKALHHYISVWHSKHPMPYDFFNCINEGAGENLNWFWKSWFFDNGVPDLAIGNVQITDSHYTVTINNIGKKPVPVDLTATYTDGSTYHMHQSIACWKDGNTAFTLNFTANKKIQKLVLGGDFDADVNKANNLWRQ
ncbi:M1 family metallopeptidase [uncultured Mucilaginibacter sp.]|uniref:M1 family metallopeptidase n=1 Tax=uncultured Mucilaginibacter sp. TaxID=797541 RepID=UPI0025D51F42|nr:M1 family metallopeptidase [uncultured Mucilaginibacter sp.]